MENTEHVEMTLWAQLPRHSMRLNHVDYYGPVVPPQINLPLTLIGN